jgi:hypothetical protein
MPLELKDARTRRLVDVAEGRFEEPRSRPQEADRH